MKQKSIQEFIEWQSHQFFPGYYSGGRMHPLFRSPSQILKYVLLLTVTILILLVVATLLSFFQS